MTAAILAHQGGWDEILMVLVPIAIFAVLLVVANRRADAMEERRTEGDGDDEQRGARGSDPRWRGGPPGR